MLSDRGGKMWSMFAKSKYEKRPSPATPACFELPASAWFASFDFEAVALGEDGDGCERNWLAGTPVDWPRYSRPAPALLGYDETIFAYCSASLGWGERFKGNDYSRHVELPERCVAASENILRVIHQTPDWNMCMNLHWQMCAVRGLLHGQAGNWMHFSLAPSQLDVGVFERPSWCVGDCATHYSVGDVYFAEVCVLSVICRNSEELWALEVGELFACDLDTKRLLRLRDTLSSNSTQSAA
jgi:hypothetical protein